ncbi:MAG: ABC transporter permease subunit [Spirochaetaceae bacterium]|jgi:putative spermidine/putrescine transport system permease protein|nr:ABC transporter permease subunit [Spirochaetaceae bacterium]
MKRSSMLPYITLALVGIFLLLPIFTIGIYSFVTTWKGVLPQGFTLRYYAQVFRDPRFTASVIRVVSISVAPILISGTLVLLALYSSILYFPWLDKYIQSICMLPRTMSGVIMAISALSLYAGTRTPFANRIVMLTCLYCITILPFIYQGIRNNLHAVNIHQLIEAAEILGAGKLYAFFRIVIPNILSGIMVSALLGMSAIFTDYVVVKIIAGSRYITAQQVLYSARDQMGQYSSVIVLIIFILIMVISGISYSLKNKSSQTKPVSTEE